ncbi:Metallo-dependent phosphatase-like protein [Mycena galopus ATCC 62051]|nr:Metallo-dependent phosphatase-like protein [Mycena galopus ATCC 62051]
MSLLSGLLVYAALVLFVVAQTELPPIPADLTTPVQQRLAFNGPMSMRIGWSTFQQLEQPMVHFGESPHAMSRSASSQSSTTYPTSRTWSNTVTLTMLKPYTTYYYKIVSTNSTVGSFKTARAAGDPTPFTIIDMGVFGPDGLSTRQMSYTGQAVVNSLNPGDHTTIQALVATASQYEFILHPGDFAYADAWLSELNLGYINGTQAQGPQIYEALVEQFFDQLATLSGIGALSPFWYSFDYGMTHYLMFDTETDFGNGIIAPDEAGGGADFDGPFGSYMNQQIDFIEKDLAAVDRSITPWVIAAGHRPGACTTCQETFEPLLIKHGVDLLGPLANNTKDPAGHFEGLDLMTTPDKLPS